MFLDVWWVPPSTAAVHFLIRVPVVQWELPLSHGGGGLIDKQEMENPKRLQKVWKQVGYIVIYIYIYIFNIGNLPDLGSFRSIDGCNFCVDCRGIERIGSAKITWNPNRSVIQIASEIQPPTDRMITADLVLSASHSLWLRCASTSSVD